MKLQFTKMHGLGNDFIIVDGRNTGEIDYSAVAEDLCRRRFAIGADGILVVKNSGLADLKMEIYNSDGSVARMCGNGIRCFSGFVYREGILPCKKQAIETLAGIMRPEIIEIGPLSAEVKVDMGPPSIMAQDVPMSSEFSGPAVDLSLFAKDRKFEFTAVSMGNPHCVIFCHEITDELVRVYGPIIEIHEIFPQKANVEFVKVVSRNLMDFRVWERGAGETLACGTGACAATVAGITKGLLDSEVTVRLPGGPLLIHWDSGGSVFMTGPAEESFRGQVEI